MAKKTKQGEILNYFLKGKSLTVKLFMDKFGTHKLSARVSDFQKKYNVKFLTKDIKSKSRYGKIDIYTKYSLNLGSIVKIEKQLK